MIYLLSTEITVTIVVISILLVLTALAVIYIFVISKNKLKKQVGELDKQYRYYHDLLLNESKEELKRIYSIAQLNDEYLDVFSHNDNLHESILKNEDSKASQAIDSLKLLLDEKKFSLVKENIPQAKDAIEHLKDRFENLKASLNQILSVDDEYRRQLLTYQKRFRDLRQLEENHRFELKYVSSSIEAVFNKLEEFFIEINNLFSYAKYQEAKEKIPEVAKIVDALDKALSCLPKLVTLAFVTLPSSLNELQERYDSLINDNYPLHHIFFNKHIDEFNQSLDNIQQKLKDFQTKNVEYDLNQIRDGIFSLNDEMDDEIRAKEDFTKSFDSIYNSTYKLENRFIKLRRVVPEYKSTYIIENDYVNKIEDAQRKINELDSIKRNLDIYVHSTNPQPYTLLNSKLLDLKDIALEIDNSLNLIQVYLQSLKTDSEEAYKYISDAFLETKDQEYLLRKINIKSLINFNKPAFKKIYDLIDSIGSLLQNPPLDVSLINEQIQELKEAKNALSLKLEDIESLQQNAEQSLVLANQYRIKFYDVRNSLLTAEKAFFEGDFSRTSDVTISIFKKINPEAKR